MSPSRLKILFIATKPALPALDGGRLLMRNTITELGARGHHVTFVAPNLGASPDDAADGLCETHLVPARPADLAPAMIRAILKGKPVSVLRHSHRRLQSTIARLLKDAPVDVIHAEQIQALFNLPADINSTPVVLRAQNVESFLWRKVAKIRTATAMIARGEARKMAVCEAAALRTADATVTLTRIDGETLSGGAGMCARRVRVIPPPFPAKLPSSKDSLSGAPAIVLVGGGWLPNRDSTAWFLNSIWNDVRQSCPGARLHIFGGDRPSGDTSVTWRPAPEDSIALFPEATILVVPLRIASGIRMKILEAWARGVPVVATPEATAGLGVEDGEGFLVASDGTEFRAAIQRIHEQPMLRENLIEAGRKNLNDRHSPSRVTDMLEETYLDVIREQPVPI